MKWEHALSDYKNYLRIERGLSENTFKNYVLDLKKLQRWLQDTNADALPLTISEEKIQEFLYHVGKTMNPRSQSRIISGLRGFFNYLVFEGYR
ncbi:MAG: site-specific integrase, partial [Marinirhabdus sp.]|nr:site-specific integrase [Marinirhabdus sp.]